MDTLTTDFVRACTLDELKAKGRIVLHGRHTPILLVHDGGRVFALDNRCPHMGFPLDRGSVDDGILTCHWHHARFELASGCTFDLWADDVPTCPVEIRGSGEVWVKPTFGHADPRGHWRKRFQDGMAHNLGLVIAKAVQGQRATGASPTDIVGQAALFGLSNRDEWGTGLTILTALGNLLHALPDEETYLALFHGVRRVAADCDGQSPRRERAPPMLPSSSDGCATGARSATGRRRSGRCSRRSQEVPLRPPWPTSCSRRPRTESMPIAATRSTSSTRPSSAWT